MKPKSSGRNQRNSPNEDPSAPPERANDLLIAAVGRPIGNISPTIEIPHLPALVLEVMRDLRQVDREITDRKGGRFQLRILPYRTVENKIDGAIISIYNAMAASAESA